ncbi:MAG: hypothetical protein ACO1Q7_17370 [Gemmatimonas sp.]
MAELQWDCDGNAVESRSKRVVIGGSKLAPVVDAWKVAREKSAARA